MARSVDKMILQIAMDNKKAIKGILEVQNKSKIMATKSQGFLKKLKSSWLGMAVAIGGVVLAVKNILKLTIIHEKAVAKLNNTLIKNGSATKAQVKDLLKYNNTLQDTTGFSNDEITAAQAMLGTFKLTAEQIKKLTPRLLDMNAATESSTGTQQDLTQTALQLGKVFTGYESSLSRVGVTVTDAEKKNLKLATGMDKVNIVTQILDNNFKGTAETVGKTFGGQVKILSGSFDDLQKSIGELIIPILIPLVSVMTKVFKWLTALPGPIKIITIGAVGLIIAMKGLSVALGMLSFNPVILGLTAVVALVGGLIYGATRLTKALDQNVAGLERETKAYKKNAKELEKGIEKYKKLSKEAKEAGRSSALYDERIARLTISLDNQNKVIGEATGKLGELKKEQDSAKSSTEGLTEATTAEIKAIMEGGEAFNTSVEKKKGSISDYYNYLDQKRGENAVLEQEEYNKALEGLRLELENKEITREEFALRKEELKLLHDEKEIELETMKNEQMDMLNYIAMETYGMRYEQLTARQRIEIQKQLTAQQKFWSDIKGAANQGAESVAGSYGNMAADFIFESNKMKKNFGDFVVDMIKGIGKTIVKMLMLKTIMAGLGFLTGGLTSILGFAEGTDSAPGGMAWVGERGKELMYVPQGAQIVPHHKAVNVPHYADGVGGDDSSMVNSGNVVIENLNLQAENTDDFMGQLDELSQNTNSRLFRR